MVDGQIGRSFGLIEDLRKQLATRAAANARRTNITQMIDQCLKAAEEMKYASAEAEKSSHASLYISWRNPPEGRLELRSGTAIEIYELVADLLASEAIHLLEQLKKE